MDENYEKVKAELEARAESYPKTDVRLIITRYEFRMG